MRRVVVRKADYELSMLRSVLFETIDSLTDPPVEPGSRVLIKPNLLIPAKPDRGIVTHPLVVKAVAEYFIARGASVTIQDSPAVGSFERVLKESRYTEILGDLSVKMAPFAESVRVNIGDPFGAVDIARDAIEADRVINIAKLKTHSQMLLTLGVKNTFGCIVGYRKPEWHFRSGVDRFLFARLLTQIHRAVRPALTIVDGILALEGQGPGKRGTPRKIGAIYAGIHAPAVDAAICKTLGIDPNLLPTHLAAKSLGLIDDPVRIDGEVPEVRDLRLPVLAPLTFGPKRFHGFIRKHLLQRPALDRDICRRCGECWKYCPAKAIAPKTEVPSFDYGKCIRCYCCIEVCPHGALHAKETVPGRLIRKLPVFNR
jgi:uncharacterized protein (DUF362 family)/Pyruvate/2-oxoacid:ferredoxin oxidoreductase delta subunit